MSVGSFTLSYTGGAADEHQIEFYDVSQAMVGFQRSLAITTHLIINDKVITQAPSLKGAQIFALPAEDGSWKITAAIAVGIYTIGTAPIDTPLGHLIASAYDYVVSETLGFHVDFEKTLGQQYEDLKYREDEIIKPLEQSRFDSVIEKCEPAIREMHRPIVKSETAIEANIYSRVGRNNYKIRKSLDNKTYEHIIYTIESDHRERLNGRVSSYNVNTYRGRIYLYSEKRPISFEIAENARDTRSISTITGSLSANALDKSRGDGDIGVECYRRTSKTGKIKSIIIVKILSMESLL